jgi:hypothetical protein
MSKVSVKTKNSKKNRIVMQQSDIVAGFTGYMLLSTEILQRNAEEHQAGGLEEIVRIQ